MGQIDQSRCLPFMNQVAMNNKNPKSEREKCNCLAPAMKTGNPCSSSTKIYKKCVLDRATNQDTVLKRILKEWYGPLIYEPT